MITKTKMIAASIALSSLLSVGATQAATAVYNYDGSGAITSIDRITGLIVRGQSYDLTFSDTWDGVYVERTLARDITIAFASALNPSNAPAGTGVNQGLSSDYYADSHNTDTDNAGTLNSTSVNRVAFDENASLTPGCDSVYRYVSKCEMFLVSDYQNDNGSDYIYYVTNDEKSIAVIENGQDENDSRNYAAADDSHRLIQPVAVLQDHISDSVGGNALYRTFMSAVLTPPPAPVPVPAAAFLFAPALLGFSVLRRKKKDA